MKSIYGKNMLKTSGRGFSLIEMIIAIAILAILSAAVVPVLYRGIDAQRHQATFNEMEMIAEAILGNPAEDNYGYIGDMGGLPASLNDLNANPGATTHSVQTNGVSMGWNGPYLNVGSAPNDYLSDAWNRLYVYDSATGQITSGGLNGTVGDTDDIIVPPNPVVASGTVAVTVTSDSIQNPGNTEQLDNTTAVVVVLFSNNGTEAAAATTYNGSSFVATGANIHRGVHAVVVNGLDGPYVPSSGPDIDDFSGRTGAANVVVGQGVSMVTVYIQ